MSQCWICDRQSDSLSKEHIIPRLFQGYVTTEQFSCYECNQKLGEIERHLTQISILMQNLDNAHGEPRNVVPKGESPKKERKWFYGDKPRIELSTAGSVRADGWERPPGKIDAGTILWRPGNIPVKVPTQVIHKSMLKAIMALACHAGFPSGLFAVPLQYLAGSDDFLPVMQPTSLGFPTRELFARVWVVAPPAKEILTIYGVVVYGPWVNIYRLGGYRLGGDPNPPGPFCVELRAYSREIECYFDTNNYRNWMSALGEELTSRSEYDYIGLDGPYSVRMSRQSGLVVLETSPSAVGSGSNGALRLQIPLHPLVETHAPNRRFENWVKSVGSEREHARFLVGARQMDEWTQTLHKSG